jgi:cytochrome c
MSARTAALMVMSAASAALSQACPEIPAAAGFARETLIGNSLNQPEQMTIASDGRVFIAQRGGTVIVYDRAKNPVSATAATLPVFVNSGSLDVGGLIGIAVGPGFLSDNWLYAYWAPSAATQCGGIPCYNGGTTPTTGRLHYRLSRFKVTTDNTVNLSSEQIFFENYSVWATHNGGDIRFGKDGNLFLATGDNNVHDCSNQYSPMDKRPDSIYAHCDGGRTTANTNSLLGKVLRIKPSETLVNGRYYTIPAGNLFPEGTDSTRPEIYLMGFRNPYRIYPDPVTNRLYVGMFGPAAGSSTARGPAGADQLFITAEPGFFGYPYFLKDNQPYCNWDYTTHTTGGACANIPGQTPASTLFDPAAPRNLSPRNTGKKILPPAKPAVFWEHDGSAADPITGSSGAITHFKSCGMGAGPVYRYDQLLNSSVKFPPYFENKWILYGIQTSQTAFVPRMITMPEGPVTPINNANRVVAMPWTTTQVPNFSSIPIDMEFGPDGALYVLDYGSIGPAIV